jgi:uncharacterized membrane protein
MDSIVDMFNRGMEELLGRAGGPLHFRLLVMPIVVSVLAALAGMADARQGRPPFLWAMFTRRADRASLVRSALKDVGKVFVVATVLDTIYQLTVLKSFSPVQVLIVAVGCAIVPYVLIRGPVGRVMRWHYNRTQSSGPLTKSR